MASADADAGVAQAMPVELAWSDGAHRVHRCALHLPAGSTALDALRAADLVAVMGAEALDALQLSLWGRACPPATLLQPHDRLELLRPLQVDPKEARRLRYRRDGLRPRRKSARR